MSRHRIPWVVLAGMLWTAQSAAAGPAIERLADLASSWGARLTGLADARARLEFSLADCELPTLGVVAAGVELGGTVRAGRGPDGPFELRVGALRRTEASLPLEPWALELRFLPSAYEVDFSGSLRAERHGVAVRLDGRADTERRRVEVSAGMPSLVFSRPELQPKHLFPAVSEVFEAAQGRASAHGLLVWTPDGIEGEVQLGLHDLTLQTSAARVERINGVITISPLDPPQTPPRQRLSMARVDLGLELLGGVAVFQVGADGVIRIEEAHWSFAGGRIRTRGNLDLRAPTRPLHLDLDDLSLERLLDLVKLENLSGEGNVSGVLPLTLGAKGVAVRGGQLQAAPGGVLRYRPEASVRDLARETPGLDVLLPALENLHYQRLSVELDGQLDSELTVGLSIAGENPDFRGGHPVEINIQVEAHLADLLHAGTLVDQIPGRVEEEIRRLREKLQGNEPK